MRIGFDAKRAFLNASGLGNYSRNTINALQHYMPEHQLVLYTPEIRENLFDSYRNFEVHSPETRLFKLFKPIWRSYAAAHLKKQNIALYHGLSNELPQGILKTNIPSVVTIHDLIFLRFPEFYKRIDRKIYYRKVKFACETAGKIIAISEQTKADIIRFFQVNPAKIEVVYQSVSPVFYQRHETETLRQKYKLPNRFILSVGSLEPRKNQLAILKAVKAEMLDIPVVFVGKHTSYFNKMKQFADENGLNQQVFFLPHINDDEVAGLYQMANLSVYISFFEGFGLPVIEAMASGCPVITSNVSCLPETAGDAALLCPPGDFARLGKNIRLMLENEEERQKLIFKGIERAAKFHPKFFAEKMNTLYNSVLKMNHD
jgi:glycosyltransferase involved in cell wall biosynthesis